jgi:hypothetical protein
MLPNAAAAASTDSGGARAAAGTPVGMKLASDGGNEPGSTALLPRSTRGGVRSSRLLNSPASESLVGDELVALNSMSVAAEESSNWVLLLLLLSAKDASCRPF